jgi:tRNA A37 threonylcarbamoyladenosine dehydratase
MLALKTAPMTDHDPRFGGIARLFSTDGLARLRAAHVCIIGIGGVGSWTAEALARSGVGALTLIDLDEICVTNMNRQLHATEATVGQTKVAAMTDRIRSFAPGCRVNAVQEFFTAENAARILDGGFACVVDAIDSPSKKARLIAACRERGLRVVTTGGAGGRRDPTKLLVCDLALTFRDALLQEVRKLLRKRHGFPRDREPFGVDCVFSSEEPVYPHTDGTVCATREAGSDLRLDCNSGYGTASFVTGAFGLAAAAVVVEKIAPAAR